MRGEEAILGCLIGLHFPDQGLLGSRDLIDPVCIRASQSKVFVLQDVEQALTTFPGCGEQFVESWLHS